MNYHSYYGLEYNPFIKNSKDVMIENEYSKEINIRLKYLCQNKGIGLITGLPGLGKTTIIRNWLNSLSPSLYKVIYTKLSILTVQDFYKQLAYGLGIEPSFRKVDNFKNIQDTIMRLSNENKITPVIILDEANHLTTDILNELKMILNFDMDSRDKAIVILISSPQINNILRLNSNESLRQRITMNYNIESLKKAEVKKYIQDKLSQANGSITIFNDNSIEAITNASNGVPRVINKLSNLCMMIGMNSEKSIIDSDIVIDASNEMEL